MPAGALGKATTAVVRILNLQVILAKQGTSWVAQGIEIDYAAGGDSLEDVKKRFEDGLCETLQEHLKMFGNLHKFIIPAPAELWLDLLKEQELSQKYSHVSVHQFVPPLHADFPFGAIQYHIPEPKQVTAGAH